MTITPYTLPLPSGFEKAAKAFVRDLRHSLYVPLPDLVLQTTGYDLIYTSKNCSGYFDARKKEIAMNPEVETDPIHTLLHEMGHWIHHDVGIEQDADGTLSYKLATERVVEAFACRTYKDLFGKTVHPSCWAYYNEADENYLAHWYQGWYEDDREDPSHYQ